MAIEVLCNRKSLEFLIAAVRLHKKEAPLFGNVEIKHCVLVAEANVVSSNHSYRRIKKTRSDAYVDTEMGP